MKSKKYIIGTCSYNEGDKIKKVLHQFNDYENYDVMVVDDGSTDGSLLYNPHPSAIKILRNPATKGAGYGVRRILSYAREKGYVAVFFVSGNGKDSSQDVLKLLNAIEEGYDFVQGSRYLPGGQYAAMPIYRKIATRFIHPILFSFITGKKITDSTNGFRAIRLSMLEHQEINLNQDWLDAYELEPYLFYKAIKLGFKVKEVPVSKIYPPKAQGYTKMKPFSGWWSILRPLIYLGLHIKR